MYMNTCTSRWENIPQAPPLGKRRAMKYRAYGLRMNRKLSSVGETSPPIAGVYYGNARNQSHSRMDAAGYGCEGLVS